MQDFAEDFLEEKIDCQDLKMSLFPFVNYKL